MKKTFITLLIIVVTIFFLTHCQQEPLVKGSLEHIRQVTNAIDDKAIKNADNHQGDWLSYGRNYKEDRYSEYTRNAESKRILN